MSDLWEVCEGKSLCWEELLNLYKFSDIFLSMGITGLDDFLEGDFIPDDARIICVAGGSGSGKSFVARRIAEKLGAKILAVDDYIIPEKIVKGSNWDLPECWDLKLLDANLKDFLEGKSFEKPIYDFTGNDVLKREVFESGGKVVVEGLYSLYGPLMAHTDYSIFVDCSEDVRLGRVIKRDLSERAGRNEAEIVKQWRDTIQPMFLEYVESQRGDADLILSNYVY